MEEELNMKPNVKGNKNKTVNFQVMPKCEDIALVETAIKSEKENQNESMEVADEKIEEAIALNGEVTSIDLMMPDKEREIIEKNLNIYSDVKETQKVLNMAKINKKLSEDIKSLEIIDNLGDSASNLLGVVNKELSVERLQQYLQQKIDSGADLAKASKEVATAIKIMLDARQEMIKQLNPNNNKKSTRIALKFENDNGNTFQLGVDV